MQRLGVRTYDEWERIPIADRQDWLSFAIHQNWIVADPEELIEQDPLEGVRQWLTKR